MSVVLTGIKPTGTPHLGNYLGAIRPGLALAQSHECRFFIADLHALNQGLDGPRLAEATREVAAVWIACGLDPDRTLFYRQSDIPEIPELAALLSVLTPKGLMNRAHAYKAKVAENRARNRDDDEGVNMGLFTYPILMAADILAFDTDLVPVGADQVQHVEMAADLARAAQRRWGSGVLTVPRPLVDQTVALVPGADGRKMSKSYGNVLPVFAERAALEALVRKVPTDSLPVGAPKDPSANVLAAWFRLAASLEDAQRFDQDLREGRMGWGQAKAEVSEALDRLLAPVREAYREVRADGAVLEHWLNRGADRARDRASATLGRVRRAALGR